MIYHKLIPFLFILDPLNFSIQFSNLNTQYTYTHIHMYYGKYCTAENVGGHYIFGGTDRNCLFKILKRLKFDSTQLFNVILNT